MPAAVRLDGALRGLLNASAGPARQLPPSTASRRLAMTRAVDFHANDTLNDREFFPSVYGSRYDELVHEDHIPLLAAHFLATRGDEHIRHKQVTFMYLDCACPCSLVESLTLG